MIVSADGGNLHTLAQVGVLRNEGSYFARVRRLSQSLLLKVLSALIQWVICSLPHPSMAFMCIGRKGSHPSSLTVS